MCVCVRAVKRGKGLVGNGSENLLSAGIIMSENYFHPRSDEEMSRAQLPACFPAFPPNPAEMGRRSKRERFCIRMIQFQCWKRSALQHGGVLVTSARLVVVHLVCFFSFSVCFRRESVERRRQGKVQKASGNDRKGRGKPKHRKAA